MKFQYYGCSTIDHYEVGRTKYEHREVHFVLFGRELDSNEPVAVYFPYCPYVVIKDLTTLKLIKYSHYDTVSRMPLNGYTENNIQVHRVFVPMKREWYRVINAYKKHELGAELLDYHHSLSLQIQMILGLKCLDIVSITDFHISTERHTNVKREYTIPSRLSAQNRSSFPLVVTPEEDFVTEPTIMSVDVEAYSETGAFPNANNSFTITICQTTQNRHGEVVT
jgi:hypothetical protein